MEVLVNQLVYSLYHKTLHYKGLFLVVSHYYSNSRGKHVEEIIMYQLITRKNNYYIAGRTMAGKQITRSITKALGHKPTKEEAQEYVDRMNALEHYANAQQFSSRQTLSDYMTEWLAKKYKLQPETVGDYASKIRNHITPRIGDVRLEDLNRPLIKRYVADMIHDNVGIRTIQVVMMILSQALNEAMLDDLIPKNPCIGVEKPTYRAAPPVLWTPEELATFIKHIQGDRLYVCYLMYILLGVRRGEALALTWQDVDFFNHTITINKTITKTGRLKLWPKTNASIRTITIGSDLTSALIDLQKTQKEFYLLTGLRPEHDYLFVTSNATRYLPGNVLRYFKKACQDAGVPVPTIHDLRHQNASILNAEGIDIKEIQKRLGHAKTSTTLDIYSHILQTHNLNPAIKIEEYLRHCQTI